ncbi:MAG TPA: hypothetical protein VHL34_11965 [Rhizomicrobium sp.]|nr:hypothetical protein [Rhizomicrobium sp.]
MGIEPVRESILRGYTFLFARFFTVAGLGWLSAAFYGLACSWLLRAVSTGALGAPPASGAFNQYSLGYLVALLVVTAFFSAPMLIPFTREALGMHEEPVAAHFSYGPREWRLFVALLRFFGLVGGAMFVLIVASGVAISAFANPQIVFLGTPLSVWLSLLSEVAVLALAAFLAVRLGFFLGTIAAVEGHASLARAWALSRQNFWHLTLVFLAVAVPATIVVFFVEYALWGSELAAAVQTTGSVAAAWFKLQYDHSISISALLAVALTAVNALLAAASASAYSSIDTSLESLETQPSAPKSRWGIHRVGAFADAGGRDVVQEEYEPMMALRTPTPAPAMVEEHEPISAPIEAVVDEVPVAEPAAVVEHVEPESAAVTEPVEPEPVFEAVAAAPEEIVVPAEMPVESAHVVEAAALADDAAEAAADDAPLLLTSPHIEAPPLDPVGLSQPVKEQEAA